MSQECLPTTTTASKEAMATTNEVLNLNTLRLLYVENNPEDVELLRLLLQKGRIESYELHHTASPTEALRLIKSHEYHVCLINQQLGEETGIDLLQHARSNRCHLPVLVLTNQSEFSVFSADVSAMHSGANHFLEKAELSARGLERAIRYAINHHTKVDALRQQAEEDALTGMQNAGAFRKRLREAIARATRNQKLVALLFIDMDGFKLVNDVHGHDLGDHVLKMIAERIKGSVRETDTVGRIGGDEFAVILEGLHNPQDTGRVCQAIIDAIRAPFHTRGTTLRVGASVGIALYPEQSDAPETLLKLADQAMYHAKRQGGNRYHFQQTKAPSPKETDT